MTAARSQIADPWISEEPRLLAMAAALLGRSRRRPLLLLCLASLLAGAAFAYRTNRTPITHATLHLRLAEGDLSDPRHAPRPPRAIREYIWGVALTRPRLERIMETYGRSSRWFARDRISAVDAFREDIDIAVTRNDFIYERRPGDPPRSAQVSLSLSGPDAARTEATLHAIAQQILDAQTSQRAVRYADAQHMVFSQLGMAQTRIATLQQALARDSVRASTAEPRAAAALEVRLARVRAELAAANERRYALERRAKDLSLAASAEQEQLGLRFQILDEQIGTTAPPLGPRQRARLGAVLMGVSLALTALFIGAFDDRVYTPDDLRRKGIPVFGALPRFRADDLGSDRARRRQGARA